MTATASDHWISTEQGRLFARAWAPSDLPLIAGSTIVLFHDSLGCVELWREFPERLAATTQRRVVAYDRLGFGQSDPYLGSLPANFIRDEAATSVPSAVSKDMLVEQ